MKKIKQLVGSILALGKVAILSRPTRIGKVDGGEIIILANGPSLRQTMADHADRLCNADLMAVNFSANTQEFKELRPTRYILVDPHFFVNATDENVAKLWKNLADVDHDMTLYVPAGRISAARSLLGASTRCRVEGINAVGIDGLPCISRLLFKAGVAMPRPRNVLIPAIMTAIRIGYRRIIITGADHSWLRTLSVDDDNHVVSIQPHFYEEKKSELKRIKSDYQNFRLHDILNSMTVAFRSYHEIADFANHCGVEIKNATPGSFIDAFERTTL